MCLLNFLVIGKYSSYYGAHSSQSHACVAGGGRDKDSGCITFCRCGYRGRKSHQFANEIVVSRPRIVAAVKNPMCPQYSPVLPFFYSNSLTPTFLLAFSTPTFGDQCLVTSLWQRRPVPATQAPQPYSSLSFSISFLRFSSVIFIFIFIFALFLF